MHGYRGAHHISSAVRASFVRVKSCFACVRVKQRERKRGAKNVGGERAKNVGNLSSQWEITRVGRLSTPTTGYVHECMYVSMWKGNSRNLVFVLDSTLVLLCLVSLPFVMIDCLDHWLPFYTFLLRLSNWIQEKVINSHGFCSTFFACVPAKRGVILNVHRSCEEQAMAGLRNAVSLKPERRRSCSFKRGSAKSDQSLPLASGGHWEGWDQARLVFLRRNAVSKKGAGGGGGKKTLNGGWKKGKSCAAAASFLGRCELRSVSPD